MISTEGTKLPSTAAHLAKKDREAHSHGGKPGGTGRPVQLLPQISREERQRDGERGGHASRNGTTCIYLTVVLHSP